jgi:hypothetical protein
MPEGEVVRLRTARGSTIVAAFIPYKPDFPPKPAKPAQPSAYSLVATPFPEAAASSSEDARSRPTILMSHGTAVDLGRLLPFYRCTPIHTCMSRLRGPCMPYKSIPLAVTPAATWLAW